MQSMATDVRAATLWNMLAFCSVEERARWKLGRWALLQAMIRSMAVYSSSVLEA
jgi:hypothetical protein